MKNILTLPGIITSYHENIGEYLKIQNRTIPKYQDCYLCWMSCSERNIIMMVDRVWHTVTTILSSEIRPQRCLENKEVFNSVTLGGIWTYQQSCQTHEKADYLTETELGKFGRSGMKTQRDLENGLWAFWTFDKE